MHNVLQVLQGTREAVNARQHQRIGRLDEIEDGFKFRSNRAIRVRSGSDPGSCLKKMLIDHGVIQVIQLILVNSYLTYKRTDMSKKQTVFLSV